MPPDAAAAFVATLVDVVLCTDVALAARVRFAALAAGYTKALRFRLPPDFTIPHRPLVAVLQAAMLDPPTSFEGPIVKQQLADGMLKLIRAARRFFGPDAPAAIWADHAPALAATPDGAAFAAIGWLRLLLRPGKGDGVEWGGVATTLAAALAAVPGDGGYWDAECLGLAGERREREREREIVCACFVFFFFFIPPQPTTQPASLNTPPPPPSLLPPSAPPLPKPR